jgi:hypothetical protein
MHAAERSALPQVQPLRGADADVLEIHAIRGERVARRGGPGEGSRTDEIRSSLQFWFDNLWAIREVRVVQSR